MTWLAYVNIGTVARPCAASFQVEPLPSGLAQVMVAWRPSSSSSLKRERAERALERWRPVVTRNVRWRVVQNRNGTEWRVAGPFAWRSPLYDRVIQVVCGRDAFTAERMRDKRRLVVVDARTGAELPLAPPPPPPLDEDDDDNAAGEGAAT